MSTAALPGAAATAAAPVVVQEQPQDQIQCAAQPAPAFLHSPPDSNNAPKSDASDSELSDLDEEPVLDDVPTLVASMLPKTTENEPSASPPHASKAEPEVNEEEDIGEVEPDHWTNGVPVFKPTMKQFKDFKLFMRKVDSYGMKSGIIKICPPEEWKNAQPDLDNLVKQIKVREPIKQDIMGSNGTYRQVNILHGRSYNLPQWRQLCEQSEHQPPAKRGERRANADKPKATRSRQPAAKSANPATPTKRRRGRPAKNKGKGGQKGEDKRPMTPVSPKPEAEEPKEEPVDSVEDEVDDNVDEEDPKPRVGRMGAVRAAKAKTQSTSARRKYSRREGSAAIDEAAFRDFDYRMDISDYTPERCEELERSYWKTLTYAPPLYGADLMGTLFDEQTENWNLNKLPNILDVLGTKVPGVNTAYLYLGMWKATFAWHLEDVDLYSINYLHFGAPKQWYSISQGDARRFEAAMKSIWPTDAKACDQFLRHKAFLISPQHLLQNFGIKVNKCLSYPGEFVVTYPYGYHSGYNLGYNCAEAVNFALDSWLDMGKIAKKCECAQAQDSVWINVYEIERKLRGEETEYEETEDEEEDEEDDDDDEIMSGLPTPPASHGVKFKTPGRKRKRAAGDAGSKVKVKKIKLRLKAKAEPLCCLCPNDIPGLEVLPTDDGYKAHRMCALYLPETYIETVDGKETVYNVSGIHKDRRELKCLFCRSKRGACFQCSQKKCARAYHASCAAAAGVFVEEEEVPVFGEDGTEYKEQAFEFSCRFHRTKRDRKVDAEALEADGRIRSAAEALKPGDICQMQYYRGDIFAGLVVENRPDEETILLDVIPNGDRVEVDWKWLLLADPTDYHLPKASSKALPLPPSRKAKEQLNAKRHDDEKPRKGDVFVEGHVWAEYHTLDVSNRAQAKVNLDKPDQVWFYLGQSSTDAKAQYTEDPLKPKYNPKGNFLDTIPKPPKPVVVKPPPQRPSKPPVAAPSYPYMGMGTMPMSVNTNTSKPEKPYTYKPKNMAPFNVSPSPRTMAAFAPNGVSMPPTQGYNPAAARPVGPNPTYATQRFDVKPGPPHGQYAPAPYSHAQPVASPHSWQRPGGGTPAVKQQVIQTAMAPTPQAERPNPAHGSHQKKHTWQVYSSVYQKYAFFQVHHNRDSSKYRTPYAPWGGFTNGYQGDLRAHLTSNHDDLLRRASMSSSSPRTSYSPAYTASPYTPVQANRPGAPQAHQMPAPHPMAANTPHGSSQGSAPRSQAPAVGGYPPNHSNHPGHPGYPSHPAHPGHLSPQGHPGHASHPSPQGHPGHPGYPTPQGHSGHHSNHPMAFHHGTSTPSYHQQQQQQSQPPPSAAGKPKAKPSATPKSYKIPSKQSPVPLPANFLAARTSAPVTPTPSKLSQQVSSHDKTLAETPKESSPANVPASSATKPAITPSKVSTTPVPLPRLPGMTPHQTAAQLRGNEAGNGGSAMSLASTFSSVAPLQGNRNIFAPGSSIGAPSQERPSGSATTAPIVEALADGSKSSHPSRGNLEGQLSPAHPKATELSAPLGNQPQGFPDVPGCESMEFVERMMQNLKRASQHITPS
jgi:hypothetical protein